MTEKDLNKNRVYRFRGCKWLFDDPDRGFKGELENDYFYFSSRDELNDPQEGAPNLFWQGDQTAWIGLFKNYVWQLYYSILFVPIKPSMERLEQLFLTRTESWLKNRKGLLDERNEIERRFAENEKVVMMAEKLCNEQSIISSQELKFILQCIHIIALEYVLEYIEDIISPKYFGWLRAYVDETKEATSKLVLKSIRSDSIEFKCLAFSTNKLQREYSLGIGIDHKNGESDDGVYFKFIFAEFPGNYVEQLKRFAFAEGYCACFTKSITSSAMWGYYGDNHRGVALVFDYNEDETIELSSMCDGIEKTLHCSLNQVKYETLDPINFFLTLGRLFGDEREHWLIDHGRKSRILNECRMMNSYDNWYRQQMRERFIHKDFAWREENEYRLLLDDEWEIHNVVEKRMFRYDFTRLKGVVFGARMSYYDKLRTLKILSKKCLDYSVEDFEVYESVMNDSTHGIDIQRMEMIENAIINHQKQVKKNEG